MNDNTIGIVGQGFVGGAIRAGFDNFFNIETYDKYVKEKSACISIAQLSQKARVIFVCVPTPMRKNGSCDTRIVESVIEEIDDAYRLKRDQLPIAVIKSTVPPGTTSRLNNSVKNITVLFCPEFLTEANAIEDFKNQSRIIIGGTRPATSHLKTIFRKVFPQTPIVKTGSNTAEMVKYFINCFLSTKVSFANEMWKVCGELNVDYDKVTEYALYDRRIGTSHFSVPGPDGNHGFGGHCFPKDLCAMVHVAEVLGIDPVILKATWAVNEAMRPSGARDWEGMLGRAVSDD